MISKESNLIKELISSSQPVLLITEESVDKLLSNIVLSLKISPEQFIKFDPVEGVEELRTKIVALYSKPLNLNKKLFYISQSEKLNIEQTNTILKLLEEPPSYLRILLVSSNLSSVILTVRSRCKKIILNRTKNDYDRERTILDLLDNSLSSYVEEVKKLDRAQFIELVKGGLEELRKRMLNEDRFSLFKILAEILSKVENTNVNYLLVAESLYIKNRAAKK